jgi:hypothetical protein
MKKIFIRSPYFIQVNEANQLGSKVELYLYNKGTTAPTLPTYILSKKIASTTQLENTYNIANYAKEFIKPVAPVTVSVPTEEDVNCWAYCIVKRYTELTLGVYTLLDTETFVCLNGYTNYSDGYNNYDTSAVLPLVNTNITYYKSTADNYINVFIETIANNIQWGYELESEYFDNTEPTLWKLPYYQDVYLDFYPYTQPRIFYLKVEQLCEPKYSPITCSFINRFGGWQYLTFFKANLQSIETTSKDFNLLPSSVNYNALQGQKRTFNQQGKQKIKCNTGWVDENYFDLIQDLLLSEVVLLNGKPAIVKSQSAEYKTHLKDKNINYEIEFEFNYGLINDVI